jgi:hypothetical protein
MLAPTPCTGKHMRATCQQRRARSDPLQANCARPGPPAHPRATIMRWASDKGEHHDQSASLPRSPPCLPRLPALANTSALLASKDARVRIHFQQLCAQPGPPTHPRATIMRWASDNGEQHDQSASLPHSPSCLPDSPHLARNLDHPHTYAPPLCAAPVRTERSTTSPQASRAPNHACLTPRTGKHVRATCQQRRARSDPLPATCARP